jgi:peptide/nickel transport system permease protein
MGPEDPDKRDLEDSVRRDEELTVRTEHQASEVGPERLENQIELKEIEGLSQGRIVFRRFLRHSGAMVSFAVLFLVVVLAFSSIGFDAIGLKTPGWWKFNYVSPYDIVGGGRPTLILWPFSLGDHPFGQDEVGHDIFAQVMRGMQQSLMILFVVGVVSTVVGTIIGAVAGYFRGRLDAILMRFTDVIIIIPVILLAAIIGRTVQNAGSFLLALVLGLLVWTTLARLVRGEVLALREREFVDAAKVAGASSMRIMFRHILPNAIGVIIVSATLTMSAAILLETALSYLNFGVKFPDVSLGKLISDYQASFNTRPWLFWWPGSFIVIIALTINFIGDGLRDAFDPRQKRLLNRSARAAKALARQKPAVSSDEA